jgi:hypothetical protein
MSSRGRWARCSATRSWSAGQATWSSSRATSGTFWNAGDQPARLLEIISPAGFERFFAELVELGGVAQAEPQTLADLCARYELQMNPDSVPGLIQRFDLRFPGEPI